MRKRWLHAFRDITDTFQEVGGKTRAIIVCDEETEMFELFNAQRQQKRFELLVRANQHQNLTSPDREENNSRKKLFAEISGGKSVGRINIDREGLSRQPKSSQQYARPVQSQRLADCEIRLRRLTMHTTNKMPDAEPVLLSSVHVREMASPEDEEPIEWFLLTTLPVETASEAADLIGHYLQRLRIKDFFKVLKSGCRVEFLLYQEAEQLPLAVAINAVIAWRILGMTLLGRQIPECDPELMFSNAELHFLHDYASVCQNTPILTLSC